jgi:hypothetical protein
VRHDRRERCAFNGCGCACRPPCSAPPMASLRFGANRPRTGRANSGWCVRRTRTLAQASNSHSWIGFIGLFFLKTPLGLISLGLLAAGVCTLCRGAYMLMLMDTGPKPILDEVGVTEYFSSSAGRVIRWSDVAIIESLQQVPTRSRGLPWRRRNWPFSVIEVTLRSEWGVPKRVHFNVDWLEHSPSTILRAMREIGHIDWSSERPVVQTREDFRL